MVLELRQHLKLDQQLIMTPQLQLAIKLLQLNRLELIDTIRQELEENPTLEEVQDVVEKDYQDEKSEVESHETGSTKEVEVVEKIRDDIDWDNYMNEYNSPGRANFEFEKKDTPSFESFVATKESLQEHLLWQLRMLFPEQEEEKIGRLIIGSINSDGYLQLMVDDIAQMCGSTPQKVEQLLSKIQTFDPVGVCARGIGECLLIQAKHLGLDNTIVTSMIKNHLTHLENKNYKAIARALKIGIDEVIDSVKIIKSLEPRPGREFSDATPQYINPDIFVYKLDNEFLIVLNDDGMPKLCLNSFYKSALKTSGAFSGKAKDYLEEKMRSASWLIRSIHQRQKTIFKVVESILGFQKDFFEKGVEYLKPMVLRDVAQDIEMHESTISRVTTNKYVYTTQGIFELKFFFNSSINCLDGKVIASASVQEKIKQIIKNEDSQNPFSDDQIANILSESNINIARRTIAKYREIMKVLPSNKRKEY
jgi:RNA polymerase sigma-54 factor